MPGVPANIGGFLGSHWPPTDAFQDGDQDTDEPEYWELTRPQKAEFYYRAKEFTVGATAVNANGTSPTQSIVVAVVVPETVVSFTNTEKELLEADYGKIKMVNLGAIGTYTATPLFDPFPPTVLPVYGHLDFRIGGGPTREGEEFLFITVALLLQAGATEEELFPVGDAGNSFFDDASPTLECGVVELEGTHGTVSKACNFTFYFNTLGSAEGSLYAQISKWYKWDGARGARWDEDTGERIESAWE